MNKKVYLHILLIVAVALFGMFTYCSYTEPEQPKVTVNFQVNFTSKPGEVTIPAGSSVTFEWKAVGGIGDVYYDYLFTDATSGDTLAFEENTVKTTISLTTLEDGHTYNAVVNAEDEENHTAVDNFQFDVTVEPVYPTVSITSPLDGWKYAIGSDILFEWTGSDPKDNPVEFSYKLDSGSWSDWEERYNIGMEDFAAGEHTFYLKVRNEGGFEASTSVTFTVKEPTILIFNEVTTLAGSSDKFNAAQKFDFLETYNKLLEGYAFKWYHFKEEGTLEDADLQGIEVLFWIGSDHHASFGWDYGFILDYLLTNHYIRADQNVYDELFNTGAWWYGYSAPMKPIVDFIEGGGKLFLTDGEFLAEWSPGGVDYVFNTVEIDSSVSPPEVSVAPNFHAKYLHLEPSQNYKYITPADTSKSTYQITEDIENVPAAGAHSTQQIFSVSPEHSNIPYDINKPGSPESCYAYPQSDAQGIYLRGAGIPIAPQDDEYSAIIYPTYEVVNAGSEIEMALFFIPFYNFAFGEVKENARHILDLMGQ